MNKPLALTLAAAVALAGTIPSRALMADVVRLSPDFTVMGGKTLKALRGQPVVLIVAPSPRSRIFRKQVKRLEESYEQFAARGTVFVAAFTQESEGLRSTIPFAIARDGAAVAARYEVKGSFAVIVIGKDGNMDLKTEKLTGAYRVRDAILNNFELQSSERRL